MNGSRSWTLGHNRLGNSREVQCFRLKEAFSAVNELDNIGDVVVVEDVVNREVVVVKVQSSKLCYGWALSQEV